MQPDQLPADSCYMPDQTHNDCQRRPAACWPLILHVYVFRAKGMLAPAYLPWYCSLPHCQWRLFKFIAGPMSDSSCGCKQEAAA